MKKKPCNMIFIPMACMSALTFAFWAAGCGGSTQTTLSLEETRFGETEETGEESPWEDTAANPESGVTAQETAREEECVVYICGAVLNPGVYTLPAGTRLTDAVEMAGGFTQEADTSVWNLAEALSDGAMYYIPTLAETEQGTFPGNTGGVSSKATGAEETDTGKISINTASASELMTLPGIGEAKAAAIISYREEHGPFTSIEQIMEVDGIKEAVFEKIRDYIAL